MQMLAWLLRLRSTARVAEWPGVLEISSLAVKRKRFTHNRLILQSQGYVNMINSLDLVQVELSLFFSHLR